jgi:hypothetical protein
MPEQRRDRLPLPAPVGPFCRQHPFSAERPEHTFLDVGDRKQIAALDENVFDERRIENPGDAPAAVRLIDQGLLIGGLRNVPPLYCAGTVVER